MNNNIQILNFYCIGEDDTLYIFDIKENIIFQHSSTSIKKVVDLNEFSDFNYNFNLIHGIIYNKSIDSLILYSKSFILLYNFTTKKLLHLSGSSNEGDKTYCIAKDGLLSGVKNVNYSKNSLSFYFLETNNNRLSIIDSYTYLYPLIFFKAEDNYYNFFNQNLFLNELFNKRFQLLNNNYQDDENNYEDRKRSLQINNIEASQNIFKKNHNNNNNSKEIIAQPQFRSPPIPPNSRQPKLSPYPPKLPSTGEESSENENLNNKTNKKNGKLPFFFSHIINKNDVSSSSIISNSFLLSLFYYKTYSYKLATNSIKSYFLPINSTDIVLPDSFILNDHDNYDELNFITPNKQLIKLNLCLLNREEEERERLEEEKEFDVKNKEENIFKNDKLSLGICYLSRLLLSDLRNHMKLNEKEINFIDQKLLFNKDPILIHTSNSIALNYLNIKQNDMINYSNKKTYSFPSYLSFHNDYAINSITYEFNFKNVNNEKRKLIPLSSNLKSNSLYSLSTSNIILSNNNTSIDNENQIYKDSLVSSNSFDFIYVLIVGFLFSFMIYVLYRAYKKVLKKRKERQREIEGLMPRDILLDNYFEIKQKEKILNNIQKDEKQYDDKFEAISTQLDDNFLV